MAQAQQQNQDPYANYGGSSAPAAAPQDPYASYGGSSADSSSDVVSIGGQPVNLKTGVGATQAATSQAAGVAPPDMDKTQETFTYPAAGPGGPLVSTKVSPEKAAQLQER